MDEQINQTKLTQNCVPLLGPLPQHLYGSSHYGDNIEDEWFIVFLLLQLTKEIDGLVAR
jgi:hypothetical protein